MNDLHKAILEDDIEHFKQILPTATEEKINEQIVYDGAYYNPLLLAATVNRVEFIKALADHGIDIHQHQDAVFTIAAKHGYKELMEYFMSIMSTNPGTVELIDRTKHKNISNTAKDYLKDPEQAQD
jgi:predicted nucleotidyltransferase